MVKRVRAEISTGNIKNEVESRINKIQDDKFTKRVEFLPGGNSVLSLISSGRIENGGFPRGRVINIVGDGSSGKTLIALEFMAAVYYAYLSNKLNSNIYPKTKNLKLIYNNVEVVMDFNVEKMYGAEFYNSIDWRSSDTVEKFGEDFFVELKKHKPGDTVIYVVDSWDALDSDEDRQKFNKKIENIIKGKTNKDESGSFELGKQKYASKRFFKKACSDAEGIDFTFVVISQVRQKIGVTFGEKRYRAGGDALNFYTHLVIWLAEKEKLKIQRLGQKRIYGISVAARVKRSKVWKPFRDCEFKIIFDYGVDDVKSLMDWYFGNVNSNINWLGEEISRKDLEEIFNEDEEQFNTFKLECQRFWDQVEDSVTPKKQKYNFLSD